MEVILALPLILSFLLTILLTPLWIKKCKQIDMLWEDMNKVNKEKRVASSGGVVVVMAFVLGVLFYLAIRTFLIENTNGINQQIFASLTTILILGIVGLVDDVFGWQYGGLSKRFRIFLCLFASIPLIVINAGVHTIILPLLGKISLGLLYPLVFIPIGIVGATTTYNFLAGFNGLETGQGILILGFLSFISYIQGFPWLAIVGLCMVFSLIGFYFYNRYPAKVFPGDILTYSVGALIAIMAILGNFEKIAVFIFIPYILETILKIRGGLDKHGFGKTNPDGSLEEPYEKIYSLTHLSIRLLKRIKKKVYEKDVVYLIFIFQIVICLTALIIFKETLFI
jgi:UDP-N-acetylglucosamine--dolichyl-phosphate N-acetylglucosaminephosphotransferase